MQRYGGWVGMDALRRKKMKGMSKHGEAEVAAVMVAGGREAGDERRAGSRCERTLAPSVLRLWL